MSTDTGNVYIYFNPQEDVKSADAVTYDESGKVIPLSERFNAKNDDIRFSMRQNITGDSGKVYGDGVYLDSNLLDGLSDEERVQMVKARIAELGGQTFTAYDGDTPVEIKIENSQKRFKNKNGRIVSVNKDLTVKNINRGIKQEAVVLSNELISASNYEDSTPARYSHGWLDDDGKNNWEKRTVFIQEKNNSVWEATLHIANTRNGEKILYDIDPIKTAERSRKLDTTSATNSIHQSEAKSQQISEKNNEKSVIDDFGKIQYQLRIEDKNRLDILDKQETRLTADLKTLEKAYAEAIRAEYERSIKPSEETSRRAAEINRKAAKRKPTEQKREPPPVVLFFICSVRECS